MPLIAVLIWTGLLAHLLCFSVDCSAATWLVTSITGSGLIVSCRTVVRSPVCQTAGSFVPCIAMHLSWPFIAGQRGSSSQTWPAHVNQCAKVAIPPGPVHAGHAVSSTHKHHLECCCCRSAYFRLGLLLRQLIPCKATLALTATATSATQAAIAEALGIPDDGIIQDTSLRPNLRMRVSRCEASAPNSPNLKVANGVPSCMGSKCMQDKIHTKSQKKRPAAAVVEAMIFQRVTCIYRPCSWGQLAGMAALHRQLDGNCLLAWGRLLDALSGLVGMACQGIQAHG